LASTSLSAADEGFLTDYSKLSDGGKSGFTRVYIAPGAVDTIGRFDSAMVDSPEFVIDPKSKYKGLKPADAVIVGEDLRAALIEGIGQSIDVVDEPGENTALISWAVSNIRLNKAKRGVLGYTPVGAVAYGAKKALSDVVDNTRAFDVTFEVEGTDANTGEILFAMVFDLSEEGVEAEWGDAIALSSGLGKRIGCRINNTGLPVEKRADCFAIPVSE
jgi:hypothetical protein